MTRMLYEPTALEDPDRGTRRRAPGRAHRPDAARAPAAPELGRGRGDEELPEHLAEVARPAGADHALAGLPSAKRITVGIESTS